MKINLTLNIKRKTLLFVGLIVVFSFVITLSLIRYYSNKFNIELSSDLVRESANRYAWYMREELEESMEVARVLTAFSLEMFETGQTDREFVNGILKKTLEKSPNLFGAWAIWEKNAFDGKDDVYANTFGHNQTGQFMPFFFRHAGEIKQEAVYTENLLDQPYYYIPKMTKKEMITQPYSYEVAGEMVKMISCVVPIIVNGEFKGVIGVDMMPDLLQNKISEITLFNTGYAALLDQEFKVVAHKYPQRIGQNYPDIKLSESAQKNIRQGKMYDGFTFSLVQQEEVYRVFIPVWIGKSPTPWALVLTVPIDELLESSDNISTLIFIGSLAVIMLILLSLNMITGQITSPIINLVDSLHALAKGNVSEKNKLNIRTKDELGLMSKALNEVINSLQKSADFAKKIGEGNLNADFEPASDQDVLGNSLLVMRKSLQESEKETQIRQWTNEGISIFAKILRTNTDLNNIYDLFMDFLVEYTKSNQGGLFIYQNEQQILKLESCYAYERKRFLQKEVAITEGLLGQCFQEKSSIFITDIPDSYVHIRSGLGGTNPKCLALIPIKMNDQMLGVIELASFEIFEQYQIDWLEKVAENLASVVIVSQNNSKTQILLEESQKQAQELRMKEEELRQNLEELFATQSKQKDLEKILQASK